MPGHDFEIPLEFLCVLYNNNQYRTPNNYSFLIQDKKGQLQKTLSLPLKIILEWKKKIIAIQIEVNKTFAYSKRILVGKIYENECVYMNLKL